MPDFLIFIPILISLVSILLLIKVIRFTGAVETSGIIKEVIVREKVRHRQGSSIDTAGPNSYHYLQYFPVIEFMDSSGAVFSGEPQLFIRSNWQPVEGEKIQIRYLKSNPNSYMIPSKTNMKSIFVFGILGLIFSVLAAIIIFMK